MAFGTGDKNDGREPQDKFDRSDGKNNPTDNPNKKDRVRGEDDVLKDQEEFESEPLKKHEDVETPGGDGRGIGLNYDD